MAGQRRTGRRLGGGWERSSLRVGLAFNLLLWLTLSTGLAQVFKLPTANRALFEEGAEEQYFVPTPGRTWQSGTFGCVRSEGYQFHEGLDIRCLERDRKGEPTDPVLATADGTVAYVNHKPGLSNFGRYIILRHFLEGIEFYSLYAHLSAVTESIAPGRQVQAGDPIGVMGRSTNTRTPISRERAHLHFEINILLSDRFASWWKKNRPGYRNDHGNWNGRGMVGIDPQALFLAQEREGPAFSLARFLNSRPELCRVWIGKTDFPWLQRHPGLVRRNPIADKEGVAGYEVALTFAGAPFQVTPRAASELSLKGTFELLSVNLQEESKQPCSKLLVWRHGRWNLSEKAVEQLELLTY